VLETFEQILDNAGQGWRTLQRAGSTLDMVEDFGTGLGECWSGLENFGPGWNNAKQGWRHLVWAGTTLDRFQDIFT
jgi:hypothetical protein